jgi:hypothetical protein
MTKPARKASFSAFLACCLPPRSPGMAMPPAGCAAPNASRISPRSAGRAQQPADRLRPGGRPRRQRRPDDADALHRAEHRQHAVQPGRQPAAGTNLQLKNVAAVMVTPTCRPSPARPADRRHRVLDGQRQEPARRHAADDAAQGRRRQVYAMAQGNVLVGGAGASAGGSKVQINHLSVGRIAGGATVERAVPTPLGRANSSISNSTPPTSAPPSGWSRPSTVAWAPAAVARGRPRIRVRAPRTGRARRLPRPLENLEVQPAAGRQGHRQRRTGSVVMNQAVAASIAAPWPTATSR